MPLVKDLEEENKALKARIKELELLNKWYEEQYKLSVLKKFGSSKDQVDPEQLSLFNEAEAEEQLFTEEPTVETITVQRKKKSKRGSFAKNLPVEVIEHKLTEEQSNCPICDAPLHEMKQEERVELIIIPAEVKLVKHLTTIGVCRSCEQNNIETPIIKAESPKALIPKSMVSPSLLSYILYQKYVNAMPLYRQEKDFSRLGVSLTRQNLSNWVIKGAGLLLPLMLILKEVLIKQTHLHADETPVEVLREPDRVAETKSYMWLYLTHEKSSTPIVIYEYTMGRGGLYPKKFLEGFQGVLQTDGYAAYHQLEPDVMICGCWAHYKRKIVEAVKIRKQDISKTSPEVILFKYCQKIFNIDKKAKKDGLSAEELLKVRQEQSKPVFDEMYHWIDTEGQKVLPKSLLGVAITYANNQKVYFSRFLTDANVVLTNNHAERNIKPFVIGRKNWLFCNTPKGARSSAIIYSIVQTAILNDLNPLKYLNFVFEQIQIYGVVSEELLPWSDTVKQLCSIPRN